tara:strand:+ start:175 stop:1971 length:1797 start_codon:yes stop_codon:yes gene_type:complete
MNFQKIKDLKKLVTKKHLKYLISVFLGNQIGGILEMIGLGAVPIIAIYLFNPDKLFEFVDQKNLFFLSDFFKSENSLIIALSLLVMFFLFKNLFLVLMVYLQRRVGIIIRNYNVSKLYTKYLYSPYKVHVKKDPAKLIGIISQDAPNACTIIELIILILREVFLILYVIILLLLVDPLTFSIILTFFILLSILFIFFTKKYSFRKGSKLQKDRLENFLSIDQTFESIKDIKILQREKFFENNFIKLIKSQEKQKLFLSITNVIPRFAFEMLTIIMIVFIIIFSKSFGLSVDKIVTSITFLAFSSIRLIPAFKTINTSINNIFFNLPSLDIIVAEQKEIDQLQYKNEFLNKKDIQEKNIISDISFKNEIEIKDIVYKYENNLPPVINELSFKIKKGEKIGLVGPSGSGKTTLINCLLGLLPLNQGFIHSDGKDISKNFDSWKKQVGYVPQDIYLLGDTIIRNIAFGLNNDEIKSLKINSSVSISNSSEFIDNLPKKLETLVGNRGLAISGGQRQRIGIARSLYNSPNFLILDEATNALDEKLEKKIINNIFNIGYDITILIIAHRISSLEGCDKLIYLENGKIKGSGKFHEITKKYKLI